jgi:UDP-3-O-[3-hydroxymyristoyl] N-acetylglucosamine deacetylase
MISRFQQTVSSKVSFIGKGLHSGRIVRMDILPAPVDTGILFERTDNKSGFRVDALYHNISDTTLSTTIGHGSCSVSTIEHLLAALAGLQIDNALIRLNGPEVPIMDGSAAPFVESIKVVGIRRQSAAKKILLATKNIEVRDGDKFIKVSPACSTQINCAIDFAHPVIGKQTISYEHDESSFTDLCNSRTFCMFRDVTLLQQKGLALGGSLENAIVVTDHGIMNSEGLRHGNEFVRHKLLDMIGDLYLLGGLLIGKIEAYKPGHDLHAQFCKKLHECGAVTQVEIGMISDRFMYQAKPSSLEQSLAYG